MKLFFVFAFLTSLMACDDAIVSSKMSHEKLAQATKFVQAFDADKDGRLSRGEFRAAYATAYQSHAPDRSNEFFELMDNNKDGYVTANEIIELRGGSTPNL